MARRRPSLVNGWETDFSGRAGACFRLDKGGGKVSLFSMKDHKERLGEVLAEFGCQTGTLHRAEGEWLELVCAIGVPEELMDKITKIPFGKGIAGVAAEKRGPVELCNLQQDLGGVAKEDARKTGVSGSLAVPVFSEDRRAGRRDVGDWEIPTLRIHRSGEGQAGGDRQGIGIGSLGSG